MSARAPERIFVVGVPRSGTTLVQSLLAAHGAVTSFTESHFFSRHFGILPLLGAAVVRRDPGPRVREFLGENGFDDAAARELVAEFGLQVSAPFVGARALGRRFLALLDELARRRGAAAWIEKTPRHLRFVPFLARLSADERSTRFVHVIRDGLDVVASLLAASTDWERAYDLDECARRWNDDVAASVARLDSPHDVFVRYEELTTRPDATLERLQAQLGLEPEADLTERYARDADALVADGETWKAGVGAGVQSRARERGAGLTDAQRERAQELLRDDLYGRFADPKEVSRVR